jgi:hypothetical protein
MTAIDFLKDQQNLQRVIKVLTQIEHGMPAEVEVANEQIQRSFCWAGYLAFAPVRTYSGSAKVVSPRGS